MADEDLFRCQMEKKKKNEDMRNQAEEHASCSTRLEHSKVNLEVNVQMSERCLMMLSNLSLEDTSRMHMNGFLRF